MVCHTAALKKWRKETVRQVWLEQGVESDKELPNNLIMNNNCLIALAKNGELLQDKFSLIDFLKPWYGMEKYANKLLACIKKNNKYSTTPDLPSRSERKAILTAAQSLKKLKGLDDLVITEEAHMTTLQDFWFVKNRKSNTITKAHLNKAIDTRKKAKEKEDQANKKPSLKIRG